MANNLTLAQARTMLEPNVANANIPARLAELGLSLRQQNLAALMGNAGAGAGVGEVGEVGAVAVNPGAHAALMPGPGENEGRAAAIAAAREQFIQELLGDVIERYGASDALHRQAIERLVQLDDYAAETAGGLYGPNGAAAARAQELRDILQMLTATTGGPALVPAHRAEVEATLARADAFLAEHDDVVEFPAFNRLRAMGANVEGQEEEVAAGNAEQAAIQAAINESAREAAERNRREEEEAIAQIAAAHEAAYRRRMANVAGRFGLAAPTVGTAGNVVPPQLPPNEVGAPVVVAPVVAPIAAPPEEMTPQERARRARLAHFGGPPAPPKRKSRKARKAQKSRKGRKLARSRRA